MPLARNNLRQRIPVIWPRFGVCFCAAGGRATPCCLQSIRDRGHRRHRRPDRRRVVSPPVCCRSVAAVGRSVGAAAADRSGNATSWWAAHAPSCRVVSPLPVRGAARGSTVAGLARSLADRGDQHIELSAYTRTDRICGFRPVLC